ncbi:DUF1846 domain-containing protein [Candidatus Saccharibacteria bacterium]|uniref:DUF1846 domain-containing protein n=1 Tax=Candidatus Nanosyncoccus alces TaxID=2171997 RepID=A0ABY0FL34_9BACT|nr:DUF1846 domain-containing protein [Candidatus Nanosyncoccus alces]MBQ2643544.1 DUF1846 domain-containing protein [Candidatus Saccharibacteria bacterium]RYC74474.1 hypothetical protein G3RUM_00629 [Candidatus Nanosyncoccus alces]
MKKCFDAEKYLKIQKKKIKERIRMFDKLYLEFGGKLIDDQHAARTLPGFLPDLKIRLLQEFKDDAEVILCINANAIEKSKIRADHMISYETEVLRLIEFLRSKGIIVNSVVITLFNGQKKAQDFAKKLEDYRITPYFHTFTKGYPTDVDTIVSDEGYGANPFIKTTKPLVVVSAPGPCSGKLATSLSQLYHESKQGKKVGYAKFETFPVWDLPLKHPVNIAYEAATADLADKNMIDYFHLEKYGVTAVNYNRDLETFPVLKEILTRINGKSIYFSPTDMGVNVIGKCITDDKAVQRAAKDEIIRRYYRALVDLKKGAVDEAVPERIKLLMNELEISERDRAVATEAVKKREQSGNLPSACIKIGKKYVTGRKTGYLSPISSTMINAIKTISRIPDEMDLIASAVLEPILETKNKTSNFKESYLKIGEVLIALSICSSTNPVVKKALDNLEKLSSAQLHATHMIPDDEMIVLSNLGIDATCDTEIDTSY